MNSSVWSEGGERWVAEGIWLRTKAEAILWKAWVSGAPAHTCRDRQGSCGHEIGQWQWGWKSKDGGERCSEVGCRQPIV